VVAEDLAVEHDRARVVAEVQRHLGVELDQALVVRTAVSAAAVDAVLVRLVRRLQHRDAWIHCVALIVIAELVRLRWQERLVGQRLRHFLLLRRRPACCHIVFGGAEKTLAPFHGGARDDYPSVGAADVATRRQCRGRQ